MIFLYCLEMSLFCSVIVYIYIQWKFFHLRYRQMLWTSLLLLFYFYERINNRETVINKSWIVHKKYRSRSRTYNRLRCCYFNNCFMYKVLRFGLLVRDRNRIEYTNKSIRFDSSSQFLSESNEIISKKARKFSLDETYR